MDIADSHMSSKGDFYWNDLTQGVTGRYKEQLMERLVARHMNHKCNALIDIGAGTCETILKYKEILGAFRAVCTDYDPKIVEQMAARHSPQEVVWRCADIFALEELKDKFDLVFLLDMLHEVYSFYGRPDRDPTKEVDHELGISHVRRALSQVGAIVNPGGGILLSDSALCEENIPISVRIQNGETLSAVNYFFANYPCRKIKFELQGNTLSLNSRDFNILLTQYNKIKSQNWDRWNVERMEIHEYYSESEFQEQFKTIGFSMHSIVGTPREHWQEWNDDFEVLSGLDRLPDKRITLLAIKER